MPEAKVALAAVAVAALLIGLIAGYYIIPPRTLTETVISTETAKATETVKVTETKVVSSEVTKTLRVTETVSIPTTVVRNVTHVLETTKLLRSEAACVNGWYPMPPGYLYLIRGEFKEVRTDESIDVEVVKADVIELKPECCLHGIPYVKLPPLKGGVAFLVWRALVMPPHNLSVAHIVWVLPADGEILSVGGHALKILPYDKRLEHDTPVLVSGWFYMGSSGFVDIEPVIDVLINFEEKTKWYVDLFKWGSAFVGKVHGETCGPVTPYCLCCTELLSPGADGYPGLLYRPTIIDVKAETAPANTIDPAALLDQSGYKPSSGYTAAPIFLASIVPLYEVPEKMVPLSEATTPLVGVVIYKIQGIPV